MSTEQKTVNNSSDDENSDSKDKNNKIENSNDKKTNNGENVLSLLDGASSQFPLIAPELELQRLVAADKNRNLGERLEAFEDIIDSEIGDTNLTRARNIEREFGLRQIYFKFEGSTPTGTQKDRIAFAQVMDALRRGYDTGLRFSARVNPGHVPHTTSEASVEIDAWQNARVERTCQVVSCWRDVS